MEEGGWGGGEEGWGGGEGVRYELKLRFHILVASKVLKDPKT